MFFARRCGFSLSNFQKKRRSRFLTGWISRCFEPDLAVDVATAEAVTSRVPTRTTRSQLRSKAAQAKYHMY